MKSVLFLLAAANPIDGTERARMAARAGPAAVKAALESELAKAEKYGDVEHEDSIKEHLASYLSEVEEKRDHKREREAAAEGPAAVAAALEGELKEAEKYHDTEHIASLEKHWRDYAGEAIKGPDGVTPAVMRQREAAEEDFKHKGSHAAVDAALESELAKAREVGDQEHIRSILIHKAHYDRMASQVHDIPSTEEHFTFFLWSSVYNALSMGIAAMGSSTIFSWLMIGNVAKPFKPALAITSIVTFIATYHYFRIFNSWNDSFVVFFKPSQNGYVVFPSGAPFNDAYRYVDWLLTVPLLLIELILVMQLPAEEASFKMWTLGTCSALMVLLGYPGEVGNDASARWGYWAAAMVPFTYVLYELYFGLAEATKRQAPNVAALTASARYITAISWLTYPFVYMVKGVGLTGGTADVLEQIGYSMADIIAKAGFGTVIWRIAHEKTYNLEAEGLLK